MQARRPAVLPKGCRATRRSVSFLSDSSPAQTLLSFQERCRSSWSEDPVRAVELAQLEVAVAEHLDETRCGTGVTADSRAGAEGVRIGDSPEPILVWPESIGDSSEPIAVRPEPIGGFPESIAVRPAPIGDCRNLSLFGRDLSVTRRNLSASGLSLSAIRWKLSSSGRSLSAFGRSLSAFRL